MKKLIAAAFAVGVSLAAGPSHASHLDGFCVVAIATSQFVAADGTTQMVVPGEGGIIFAMPSVNGRLTVAWNKSFDVSGKSREVSYTVVQTAALPGNLQIVKCPTHIMDGSERSPFQGWLP